MKLLLAGLILVLSSVRPVHAQVATVSASPSPSPQVEGIYDDPFATEYSDTASSSASSSAFPTPKPRTATTLSATNTPVSGAVENTLILLFGGSALILLGYRFSKS